MNAIACARLSCAAGVLCLYSATSAAQTVRPALILPAEQALPTPTGPAPTPRHTGLKALGKDLLEDVKHLPSKENLYWAAFGGGLALAVHPADDNVNEALVGSDFAHNFFK